MFRLTVRSSKDMVSQTVCELLYEQFWEKDIQRKQSSFHSLGKKVNHVDLESKHWIDWSNWTSVMTKEWFSCWQQVDWFNQTRIYCCRKSVWEKIQDVFFIESFPLFSSVNFHYLSSFCLTYNLIIKTDTGINHWLPSFIVSSDNNLSSKHNRLTSLS